VGQALHHARPGRDDPGVWLFRALDPDHLLGEKEDLGITCALIPTPSPRGQHRTPPHAAVGGVPERTELGKDVFIPMEWVIGGQPCSAGVAHVDGVPRGGSSISLPSLNTGMAKMVTRATGGYARVRTQFKTRSQIRRHRGAARADRRISLLDGRHEGHDRGRRRSGRETRRCCPAIAKYHLTERGRQIAIDAMDIAGGKGICMGLAISSAGVHADSGVDHRRRPNILTRSLSSSARGRSVVTRMC